MNVDVIFHGGFVITMEGPGTGIINNGAVAVKGNKIDCRICLYKPATFLPCHHRAG